MTDGEDTVSREAARQIAEAYLAENQVPRATGEVSRVMAWDEIEGRKPLTYTPTEDFWSTHWVVYLRQEGFALRESLIMAIHRETGEVAYVGGAGDEG